MEVEESKYDRINDDRESASVWTEAIQDAERGSGSDSGISRRGRSGADDRLLGEHQNATHQEIMNEFGRILELRKTIEVFCKLK